MALYGARGTERHNLMFFFAASTYTRALPSSTPSRSGFIYPLRAEGEIVPANSAAERCVAAARAAANGRRSNDRLPARRREAVDPQAHQRPRHRDRNRRDDRVGDRGSRSVIVGVWVLVPLAAHPDMGAVLCLAGGGWCADTRKRSRDAVDTDAADHTLRGVGVPEGSDVEIEPPLATGWLRRQSDQRRWESMGRADTAHSDGDLLTTST